MDLETREYAEALLMKAARTHGIQVRKDEVQRQVRDEQHGAAFAEWAIMYLTPDNLLTADELALYTILDRSGQVDELTGLHDLAEVQAVTEEEVRIAIDELRQSTDSISKQSETLRQQHDALSRFVKKNEENDARRRDLDLDRQRKAESERTRVAAEVEAASGSLAFRISDLEEQGSQADSSFNRVLDELFRSDDKLLSSLQKLGWELDQPDPDETSKVDKLRDICRRLIKVTVETIRTRLDTLYMDALVIAERSGRVKHTTDDEIKALEAEIDSLYAEILPVAQMSVEQQHLEPALKSVTALSGQSTFRTSTALEYINECLDYLLSRLDCLQERMETHLSHQEAATSLISTAKSEMATEVLPPLKKSIPSLLASPVRKPSSPVRRRSNTGGSITRPRRRSSGIGLPEEEPLEALMQALSLPSTGPEEVEGKERLIAMARTLQERSRRYDDVARNTQETFELSTTATIDDTRRAIQLLRDSVLAESPYNKARLIDPEIVGSISVLVQEVEKAKEQLALVEGLRGDGKSEKREDFIQRWAR
ncbi:hypothetical protein PT974_08025 [Cladobotryum mycophilum]|uniref:Uncharacterized protein n=1 Tax=Cladobotryum mycophilum TaxID=491253 RepID=A0ABR0SDC8_9HYPO